MRRTRLLFIAAGILILPALALVCAPALDAAFHTSFTTSQAQLLADFGLTNASPLDVRRYWFGCIFIFAPLLASIVAALPAFVAGRRRRFAPLAFSLGAAVVAV